MPPPPMPPPPICPIPPPPMFGGLTKLPPPPTFPPILPLPTIFPGTTTPGGRTAVKLPTPTGLTGRNMRSGGATGLGPCCMPAFINPGGPAFCVVKPIEPEFSLIHVCTCILALSLTVGSAAVMRTAFPPVGCISLSMLICAPLSAANFLIVAPAGPISLATRGPGQMMLLSTALPPAGIAALGSAASMAPPPGWFWLLKSLIMSLKSLSICAFFSAISFQSTFSRLFCSAAFLQSEATWPLSPQIVHVMFAIL
mmetsp:Transcript_108927/g.243241  ORF Transcript_108927/g.243241 Transcript_108927/m.243241 type:complete len:254 (+) Transcript_108927:346-1107(+)